MGRGTILSSQPGTDLLPAAKHDTNNLPPHRALWVSEPGTVVVDTVGGEIDLLIGNLAAGSQISCRVKRLKTSSTATVLLIE